MYKVLYMRLKPLCRFLHAFPCITHFHSPMYKKPFSHRSAKRIDDSDFAVWMLFHHLLRRYTRAVVCTAKPRRKSKIQNLFISLGQIFFKMVSRFFRINLRSLRHLACPHFGIKRLPVHQPARFSSISFPANRITHVHTGNIMRLQIFLR